MPFDIIGPIADAWVNYVFGSIEITAVVILLFVVGVGLVRRWPLDVFIVTLPPIILLMTVRTITLLPPAVWMVFLIGIGVLVGIGLLRLSKESL